MTDQTSNEATPSNGPTEAPFVDWKDFNKHNLEANQLTLVQRDQDVRVFRGFQTSIVPGLLQTPDYARAIFTKLIELDGTLNNADDATQARMRHQYVLDDPERHFHIVVTEAVLRYRLVPAEVMLGQLDRLLEATRLPNVQFGLIGFEAEYLVFPQHGFWLMDDDRVSVETRTAVLNLRQPDEIERYTKAFAQQARIASYGAQARAIIERARQSWADLEPGSDS